LLLAGLALRYLLGRRRLGLAVLACAPVVDLVLLAAATVDLKRGGEAALPHALAAVSIGVSVAWGHRMIRWADARFAHRFAGGSAPERPPRRGPAHAARERRGWVRHAFAWGIGCGVLGPATLAVGDLDRSQALIQVVGVWTLGLAIDFLVSFSYTLWPRR
jgi:hypothetical protein